MTIIIFDMVYSQLFLFQTMPVPALFTGRNIMGSPLRFLVSPWLFSVTFSIDESNNSVSAFVRFHCHQQANFHFRFIAATHHFLPNFLSASSMALQFPLKYFNVLTKYFPLFFNLQHRPGISSQFVTDWWYEMPNNVKCNGSCML